jgi:hypothetical protein
VGEPLDPKVLASVPDAVRERQELFARTGSVHAAATFGRSGQIGIVREDVGRHNAVDKVVGALAVSGGLPAHELGSLRQWSGKCGDGAKSLGGGILHGIINECSNSTRSADCPFVPILG